MMYETRQEALDSMSSFNPCMKAMHRIIRATKTTIDGDVVNGWMVQFISGRGFK